MTYKTIVVDYSPKAKEMASAVENAANAYAKSGWKLVMFSVTNSAKAILVFRVPEETSAGADDTSEIPAGCRLPLHPDD